MPLAILRPDDWDFPLLVHVLGAMVLVGALVTVVTALLLVWRGGDAPRQAFLTRFAFRSLLLAVIPSYIVMRIGAQWIESREDVDDEAAWIGIGYVTADIGALLIIVATVLAGIAVRRMRGETGSTGLARAAAVVSSLVLAAYLVAMWAMTVKPT